MDQPRDKISKLKTNFQNNRVIVLILLFFAVNALLWLTLIPFNRAPDEYLHYQVAEFIANNKRLPILGTDLKAFFLINKVPIISYASVPNLSYPISAFFITLGSLFVDKANLFYFARVSSLISGLGVIWLGFRISVKMFPNDRLLQAFVPAILAMLPQLTFVSAYTNMDAFASLTSALVLYLLFKQKGSEWDFKSCLILGLSLGLLMLSKINAYILLPIALAWFALTQEKFKNALKKAVLIVGTALILISPWFTWNYIKYGDILGLSIQKQLMKEASPAYKLIAYDLKTLLFETKWLQTTFKSFWGLFDWMYLTLPNFFYATVALLSAAAIFGFGIHFFKLAPVTLKKQRLAYFTLIIIPLTALILSLIFSLKSDYQPQGRYLFTAIIPIFVIFAIGINRLIPSKLKRICLASIIALVFFINNYSLLNIIVPYYYVNLDLRPTIYLKNQPRYTTIKRNHTFTQIIRPGFINLNKVSFEVEPKKKQKIRIEVKDKNKLLAKTQVKSNSKRIEAYFKPIQTVNKLGVNLIPVSNTVRLVMASKRYPQGEAYLDNKVLNLDSQFSLSYASSRKLQSLKTIYGFAPFYRNFRLWLLVISSLLSIILIAMLATYKIPEGNRA